MLFTAHCYAKREVSTGNGVFFANATNLELLTFYDREKAADLAKFLEQQEGPRSIALEGEWSTRPRRRSEDELRFALRTH